VRRRSGWLSALSVPLSELERLDRERRASERRIKQARFPVVKSLDSFDFLAIPSLNKLLVLELMRGEFIDRCECVTDYWHSAHRFGFISMSEEPFERLPASSRNVLGAFPGIEIAIKK
jgi:IstB-like ATP binding protein